MKKTVKKKKTTPTAKPKRKSKPGSKKAVRALALAGADSGTKGAGSAG